jgi:hypothetical protein
MMQKSTTFTTIFRVQKCYFHYDFACKKVPFSLRYAKNNYLFLAETSTISIIISSSFVIFFFFFVAGLPQWIHRKSTKRLSSSR